MLGKTKGKEYKYLTLPVFEKNMRSVASSFGRIEDKLSQHDKAFTLLLKNMQTFTEEAREHRQTMSSLMRTDINQERTIEELKDRVDRLEMRIK